MRLPSAFAPAERLAAPLSHCGSPRPRRPSGRPEKLRVGRPYRSPAGLRPFRRGSRLLTDLKRERSCEPRNYLQLGKGDSSTHSAGPPVILHEMTSSSGLSLCDASGAWAGFAFAARCSWSVSVGPGGFAVRIVAGGVPLVVEEGRIAGVASGAVGCSCVGEVGCNRVGRVELIHTCYRITDPERSIAFYAALGLEKRRELPIRDEAINYFLGVPGQELPELELTYNFEVPEGGYELGTAYGHIALTVDDLDATLTRLAGEGIEPERPPYLVREGGPRICFVRDPDSYRVELIERH